MCQELLTEDEAFEVLRTISPNRKLRDVADVMVGTGVISDKNP